MNYPVIFTLAFCTFSCTSNSDSTSRFGENSYLNDVEYITHDHEPLLETIPDITQEQKMNAIASYRGWADFGQAFSKMNMDNAQYTIQTNQQLITNNRQMAQTVGLTVDPQVEASLQKLINDAQVNFDNNKLIFDIVQEQNKTLQALNPASPNNDQLFNQATGLNAVILYAIFGRGYGQEFYQILRPSLQWYFSPQCETDIQKGINYMQSINQAMALNRIRNTESGLSLFGNEMHRERFSDALLNLKSWIDPTTGERYKLDISIENPSIDGVEMREY